MTVEADKSHKCLRSLRKRYDLLLREYNGKRPTNYAKMREFLTKLAVIVDEETIAGGFPPSKTFAFPDLTGHVPDTTSEKGAVVVRRKEPVKVVKPKLKGPKLMPIPPDPKKEDKKVQAAAEAKAIMEPDSRGLDEETLAEMG